MADDDMPELEDFTEQLQKDKVSNVDLGDYSKPKQQEQSTYQPQQQKELNGLKKGFLNQDKKQQIKQDEVIKVNKKNPLEIDEVQKNMQGNQLSQMNSLLMQKKEEWLNQDLLLKISQNPKLQKLFTNAEYLQAVQGMQNNPQGVMQKYRNNPEFMEILQEYMKMMADHFQNIKKEPQTQEEKIQQIIQTDPQVKQVLQDPKVLAFIEYLQKTGKADFQEIAYKDPQLMQKLQILIQKGVLNVQKM